MSCRESIPHDGRYTLQGDSGAVEEALQATDLPQGPDEAPPGCRGGVEDGAEGLAGTDCLMVEKSGSWKIV